jgi:hypothetical protein
MKIVTRSLLPLLLGCTLLSLGACTTAELGEGSPTAEVPAAKTDNPTADGSVRLPTIRLASRATVSIASLTAERANDTVTVSGTVAQRVPLLEGWLYQVSDDSGSLWVLNDRSAPDVGENATVEGVVRYEAIVIGEIDAGEVYLQEGSSRQSPRPEDRPADRPTDRPTDRPGARPGNRSEGG